ncbi:TPA: hypothetical protein KO297_002070 [Clostridioides difficile]|nr:hypothetical protein [Clostridioides difficile]
MNKFLSQIRRIENEISITRKIINTIFILCFGMVLGTFAKFLDTTASNTLPFIFEYLDISNFFGRFAIWLLIALYIAIYSHSSIRASLNVLVFFIGMVSSYYLYSYFVAGFFPKNYAMIWLGFTVISPLLAFICWYAKGKSKISFILSVIIIAILFNFTFIYGWIYFDVYSILEVIVFGCALIALKRNTFRETTYMILSAVVIAVILNMLVPFHFG